MGDDEDPAAKEAAEDAETQAELKMAEQEMNQDAQAQRKVSFRLLPYTLSLTLCLVSDWCGDQKMASMPRPRSSTMIQLLTLLCTE